MNPNTSPPANPARKPGWLSHPLLSLLLGVVVGGLIVLATLVWPLYAKLRKATRAVAPSQDAGA